MDNPGEITEILRLCRLCLVKDQVNIPIFDEQGDIRQIFLKISSCLPVKVSREDQLPKKICDGCSNKLDLLYEFWNTSANAEKTLLSWLGQAGVKDADETISAVAQQIAKPVEIPEVKEETEPLEDGQVPSHATDSFPVPSSFDEGNTDEAEAPPPKRARRTAAVKAQINLAPESDDDEDDDMDNAEPMTKMEDESDESEGEEKDPSYSEVPGTSADDQAGPSGVGKDGVEAPKSIRCNMEKLKHIKKEQGEESKSKFHCVHCGNFFTSKIVLKEHIVVVHTHEFRYFCDFCGKGFYMESRKRFHEKKVHHKLISKQQNIPWACDECGRVLANKYSFKQHKILVHEREIKFYCDQCGKGFPLLSYLIRHSEVNHPKHERLTCEEENCCKSFKTKDALKRHQFVHQQNREFCCEYCPKKFIHIVSFKRHLREHRSGRRVFECEVCSKILTSTTSLQDHMRIHTGEKPYTCPHCDKAFVSNKHLKVHTVVHTKEKRHVCKVCDKRFTQRGSLRVHFLKNHPDEVL